MKVERNFDFFMAGKSEGLTQAGMGRLNQSNEAFVYCILGAQVTIRSSILGSSGSATEVQHEFLILVEDPIRTPEISTSVQRFQLATERQKLGLILHSHHLTWKLNCWNRMLKPRLVLFPPLQIPNPHRFLCWTLFVPEAMPVSHNVNSTIIPALLIHKNGPIYTFLSAFPVKNLRISRLLNSFMASWTS